MILKGKIIRWLGFVYRSKYCITSDALNWKPEGKRALASQRKYRTDELNQKFRILGGK